MKHDSRSFQNNKMMGNVSNSISNQHMQRKSQGDTEAINGSMMHDMDSSENAMAPFNMRQNDLAQQKRLQDAGSFSPEDAHYN